MIDIESLNDLSEEELQHIRDNVAISVEEMEFFLKDLEEVQEELLASNHMYEETIKNLYQTSPELFDVGAQAFMQQSAKQKFINWIKRKAGRHQALVPETVAKVLKEVKPGELQKLREPRFFKSEYAPTFDEAIPVPRDSQMIIYGKQDDQNNNAHVRRSASFKDPIDEQDWKDIHREVLNDLIESSEASTDIQSNGEEVKTEPKADLKFEKKLSGSLEKKFKLDGAAVQKLGARAKFLNKKDDSKKLTLSKYSSGLGSSRGKQRTHVL